MADQFPAALMARAGIARIECTATPVMGHALAAVTGHAMAPVHAAPARHRGGRA